MLFFLIAISLILNGVLSSLIVVGSDCNSEGSGGRGQLTPRGPDFPRNSSAYNLTIPEDLTLRAVTVGIGTQNYTCSLTSGTPTWKPVGAMAQLRDITDAEEDPEEIARAATKKQSRKLLSRYTHIATHYFVPHGASGAGAPAFFFDPRKNLWPNTGPADNYVIVAKIGLMPAPNHPKRNVPWLALKGVDGNAASLVFRTNTHFGASPPESVCVVEGEEANMGYSALYWFYH
ncbi:uncharacterized protein MELLADRAFT_124323 [Melampsora larici-populina 98AG31]|uniref:Secreted protein n=1 Tax=Melampsora larici-populina (strain 98AG31 / pathotype 3-4-7) TaxID=747676 RepID=F4R9P9_MELLP|nr:uncharacterized protein MELLADRAFT_124323 [Melampsora larici-populina 98AG31]EGG11111.1 hypothetical protein MELLADRAFT_124323 [Melampsora larici-populina 98AG31]